MSLYQLWNGLQSGLGHSSQTSDTTSDAFLLMMTARCSRYTCDYRCYAHFSLIFSLEYAISPALWRESVYESWKGFVTVLMVQKTHGSLGIIEFKVMVSLCYIILPEQAHSERLRR